MIGNRAGLEPYTPGAGDLGWVCRSMVFSWRVSEVEHDAAELFFNVFGCDASSVHRNKFPTASMPCRSWARGLSDGIAVDLSIGVDGDHSQMRLFAKADGEPVQGALAQFKSRVQKLEAGTSVPLIDRRGALDLELPDHADRNGFMRWLGHEDWQANASLLRQEYMFLCGGSIELSLAASLDRRVDFAGLVIQASFTLGVNHLVSAELFDAFHALLSVESIADLATI